MSHAREAKLEVESQVFKRHLSWTELGTYSYPLRSIWRQCGFRCCDRHILHLNFQSCFARWYHIRLDLLMSSAIACGGSQPQVALLSVQSVTMSHMAYNGNICLYLPVSLVPRAEAPIASRASVRPRLFTHLKDPSRDLKHTFEFRRHSLCNPTSKNLVSRPVCRAPCSELKFLHVLLCYL